MYSRTQQKYISFYNSVQNLRLFKWHFSPITTRPLLFQECSVPLDSTFKPHLHTKGDLNVKYPQRGIFITTPFFYRIFPFIVHLLTFPGIKLAVNVYQISNHCLITNMLYFRRVQLKLLSVCYITFSAINVTLKRRKFWIRNFLEGEYGKFSKNEKNFHYE